MSPANREIFPDPDLRETLLGLYPELRRIARRLLSGERQYHTLQPTALANEAVARLLSKETEGVAPEVLLSYGIREMKTILIDSGRRYQTRLRLAPVHGSAGPSTRLEAEPDGDRALIELIHLQRSLDRLRMLDPRACQVVELRFFAGLRLEEVAAILGLSSRTVSEDWEFARSWLAAHWSES